METVITFLIRWIEKNNYFRDKEMYILLALLSILFLFGSLILYFVFDVHRAYEEINRVNNKCKCGNNKNYRIQKNYDENNVRQVRRDLLTKKGDFKIIRLDSFYEGKYDENKNNKID